MYDPNLPLTNANITSAVLRGQFNGLKDLIDAIQGGITNVVVEAVNTLPPGSNATASVALSGSELRFTFGLPQGETGSQGPPFAQALVDGVNTLEPGQPASVDVSFDGTNIHLTFGIPRGQDGNNGTDGQPGEVSRTELNNAQLDTLSQCSANTNGVSTLDTPMNDPEAEALRQKLNELVNAMRR